MVGDHMVRSDQIANQRIKQIAVALESIEKIERTERALNSLRHNHDDDQGSQIRTAGRSYSQILATDVLTSQIF
jgi:hypothetical protein